MCNFDIFNVGQSCIIRFEERICDLSTFVG